MWKFPIKLPLKAMWDLWYFGHREMGIRPYRLLRPSITKCNKQSYNRAGLVVMYLTDLIQSNNLLPEGA